MFLRVITAALYISSFVFMSVALCICHHCQNLSDAFFFHGAKTLCFVFKVPNNMCQICNLIAYKLYNYASLYAEELYRLIFTLYSEV